MDSDREEATVEHQSTRVVRPDSSEVEPLYPYTRLLKTNVVEAAALAGEARQGLEQARADAQRVRDEARSEVENLRQQAYEEGSKQAAAQIGKVVGAISQAAEGFNQDVARRVVRLVQTFAGEILHMECEIRPDTMVKLVTSVLECAKNYSAFTVVLHPDDLAVVRPHDAELLERLPFAESIQFKEDPELERHGCRIETDMGTFDGSLSVQLSRLHKHLLDEQRGGQSGCGASEGVET